jgi:hypothetical protein
MRWPWAQSGLAAHAGAKRIVDCTCWHQFYQWVAPIGTDFISALHLLAPIFYGTF